MTTQVVHLLFNPEFVPFCPNCFTVPKKDRTAFPELCDVCGAKLLPLDRESPSVRLGRIELGEFLPFGPEALLLDSAAVLTVPIGDSFGATGIYSATGTLTVTEAHCAGHFPGYPVFPGHLYPEVANQVFAALVYVLRKKAFGFDLPDPRSVPLVGRFTKAEKLVFRGETRPGDVITMKIVTARILGEAPRGMVIVYFNAKGTVGERDVFEGTQTCIVSSKHPAKAVGTATPFTGIEVLAPELIGFPPMNVMTAPQAEDPRA